MASLSKMRVVTTSRPCEASRATLLGPSAPVPRQEPEPRPAMTENGGYVRYARTILRAGFRMFAMPVRTRDLRVESIRPLLPPAILLEELPLRESAAVTVSRGR